MDRRVLGLVLAGLGAVLALVSGLADVIGINFNEGADDEFGWKQIVGLAAGVLIVVAGLVIALTARDRAPSTGPPNRAAGP
jgi:drug/metabolite transporter (DMT)-like permease